MTKSAAKFLQALLAVLAGNLLYFAVEKYLPPPMRHVSFRTDLGTVVDFLFCLVLYQVIKAVAARR